MLGFWIFSFLAEELVSEVICKTNMTRNVDDPACTEDLIESKQANMRFTGRFEGGKCDSLGNVF